jgi:hypothetical protein
LIDEFQTELPTTPAFIGGAVSYRGCRAAAGWTAMLRREGVAAIVTEHHRVFAPRCCAGVTAAVNDLDVPSR